MSARFAVRAKADAMPHTRLLTRLLDPIDWLSEAIYSILIVLTFTLAFGIIHPDDNLGQAVPAAVTDELLFAALGATVAWGMIDGIMYALLSLFERSERHRLLRQIGAAKTEEAGVQVIAEEFDYILEPIIEQDERYGLYGSMLAHLRISQVRPIGFKRKDFAGALGSLLVAVLAVLPSLVPLIVLRENYMLAIRTSNVVSFTMLFLAGYQWGKHTGTNPWTTGLLLSIVGALMVLIAIPLGG